jgi:hypothetical protein
MGERRDGHKNMKMYITNKNIFRGIFNGNYISLTLS